MKHVITMCLVAPLFQLGSLAQPIGVPTIPDELPRTAVLIEKARTQKTEHYVAIPGVSFPPHLPVPTNLVVDSNLYVHVAVEETVYDPLGSGVVFIYSGLVLSQQLIILFLQTGMSFFAFPREANLSPGTRRMLWWSSISV
jgi:hypothetical protein